LAAIAGTFAVSPAAFANLADLSVPRAKDGPTVTFVASGPAGTCGSQPDRPTITIYRNAWLNLVNHTGTDATLWLERVQFPLADDTGRAFKLRSADAYTVIVVPDCPVTAGGLVPLLVQVLTETDGGGSASAGPPPTGLPSGSRDDPPAIEMPGQSGGDGIGMIGGPGEATPTTAAVNSSAAPDIPPGDVEYESSGPFAAGRNGQGFRLLAIIAAVCVFGVSAAIIRVILAQRAIKTVDA
jgi:hypothetical protein